MLSESIKDNLKANWGEKADALECLAPIKIHGIDYDGEWCCFIFAMNPEDEDEVMTLTRDRQDYELMLWSVDYIFNLFGNDGEYVKIDHEYKPRNVKTLLKSVWKY